MEMKVDSQRIRAEREKRAWTQEHLAQVTGLGARTIQRIEQTGLASKESIKALAAVLELDVQDISLSAKTATQKPPGLHLGRVAAVLSIGATILAASLFTVRASMADGIELKYAVSIEDQNNQINEVETLTMGTETIEQGDTATILFADMKLEITPTVQNDGAEVKLDLKLFEQVGGEFLLRAEPKLITQNEVEAAFRSSSQSGDLLSVYLNAAVQ